MEWALNAMRQSENGFGTIPNVTDDMGIVKLRGLPFGCSKEEIVQFFEGMAIIIFFCQFSNGLILGATPIGGRGEEVRSLFDVVDISKKKHLACI